jgi:hypothetical protein
MNGHNPDPDRHRHRRRRRCRPRDQFSVFVIVAGHVVGGGYVVSFGFVASVGRAVGLVMLAIVLGWWLSLARRQARVKAPSANARSRASSAGAGNRRWAASTSRA